MKSENYSNVLVVNVQSMTSENATCITMRSLFSEWPKGNICEVSVGDENIVCDYLNTVTLDNSFFPFRKILMSKYAKNINNNMKTNQAIREKRSFVLKEKIRQFCYGISDCTPIVNKKEIIKKTSMFKPDIIYTVGCSVLSLKLSQLFSKYYKIPIVVHFMDNWLETLEWDSNIFLKPYHKILKRHVFKCYKTNDFALTISDAMSEYYEKITSKKHYALMNNIDVKSMWSEPLKDLSSPLNIVYAGGLHLDRWITLKSVEERLKEYERASGKKVFLNIYTNNDDQAAYSQYFSGDITKFYKFVPHEQIKSVYEAADVLLHIEALDSNINNFFKYSISTKIPEYLASGRNVVLLCSKNTSLYSYLKDKNAAYVIDNVEEISEVLNSMWKDPAQRTNKIINAKNFALENHDSDVVRKKLRRVLMHKM